MSDMVAENNAKLIISGMGSGKTGATLDGIWRLMNRFEAQHALVVAPLFVAKNTWVDEILAWEHTRSMSYATAVGDPIQRREAVKKRAEITTINFENLPWLAKFIGTVENWYWDMVVIDESSRLKAGEARTKTTKVKKADGTVVVRKGGNQTRFGILTTARRKTTRVVELTGTPAPQGLIDLWGQSYLLDGGEALGRSKSAFEREYFHIDREKHIKEPKSGSEAKILDRLKHLLITIPQEKVTEDAQIIPMKCRLPDDAMAEYKELEKTLYNEKFDIEAVSRGVLANKLLQACISKGTPVLTSKGWIPIEKVTSQHLVWDGIKFVCCKGAILKGFKVVESCFGVDMTLDHKVLTVAGWKTAKEILYGESCTRFDREDVRLPDGIVPPRYNKRKSQKGHMGLCLQMWQRSGESQSKSQDATSTKSHAELRLHDGGNGQEICKWSWDDKYTTMGNMAGFETSMLRSEVAGFRKLWGSRNKYAGTLAFVSGFLGRCVEWIRRSLNFRSNRQQFALQCRKLSVVNIGEAGSKQAKQSFHSHTLGKDNNGRGFGAIWHSLHNAASAVSSWLLDDGYVYSPLISQKLVDVYDVLECGDLSRFVVCGSNGPILVHNCNGHWYQEDRTVVKLHEAKYEAYEELRQQCNGESLLTFYSFKFDKDELKLRYPDAVVANEYKGDLVADWNKGRIKHLISHPASIGHGTNLQYGGHIACWFGLTFSLELWLQANMRLPRPGQTNQVLIYPIVAEGTYDERALDLMRSKGITQDRIIASFLNRV